MNKLMASLGLAFALAASQSVAVAREVPFPLGNDISARFAGTVHRNDLINSADSHGLPQANVITFEKGSHSGWHVHGAMTVIGVSGTGVYQQWGKKPVLIRQGDVVQIPKNTVHWHGATPDSRFQQIVIYDTSWKPGKAPVEHTGALGENEYRSLSYVDAADRKSEPPEGSEYLFAYPDKPLESQNFTGPVRINTIVGKGNAAGTPEWISVAFPAGVYNRWHSHRAGQVLLATDGIGYHQIKGEKPQMLRPGDVVYCPPGVVHWHGAAPGSNFAHIAISPGDDHQVTWYEFPAHEYKKLR